MPAEFSADAELRALTPWSIELHGRVFTAAVVSRPAVLAFFGSLERSRAGQSTPAEEEEALHTLLRAAFPKRWRHWWTGDPVPQILALDYRVRKKALDSFFASLAPVESPTPPGMNGTHGSRSSLEGGSGSRPVERNGAMAGGSHRV